MASGRLPVEIWSPLPPAASGVADYVLEQLETLEATLDLTLVVEEPQAVDAHIRERHHVIAPHQSNPEALRVYHVGNSPLHGSIYREAIRVPGVIVLHEWNLHELLLGFAVRANDFTEYKQTMRREHRERGSVAAEAIAQALGGKHWTSVFPLNAEILERSLGCVCLSASTAAKVAGREPGARLLSLPHHALLKSNAKDRAEARASLDLEPGDRVVVLPGLGTAAKSLDVTRAALESIRARVKNVVALAVGGGDAFVSAPDERGGVRSLGRVSLETLGDALLAADVVVALRFPSRGEASGVVMRSLAAGRATIVSAGSTADEDLPLGVVGRVNPGPNETRELASLLEFLLVDDSARERMEGLARAEAAARLVRPLTERLSSFLGEVGIERAVLENKIGARASDGGKVSRAVRDELEGVAASLGLAHLPPSVFEKLAWIQ